jgi:hypothetical protein
MRPTLDSAADRSELFRDSSRKSAVRLPEPDKQWCTASGTVSAKLPESHPKRQMRGQDAGHIFLG